MNNFSYYHCYSTVLVLLFFVNGSHGVRIVNLVVPSQAARGEEATLKCMYQMEGRSLYCVKWFKGRSEIFRYTPTERPQFKTFPRADLEIDLSQSDESRLTLRNLKPNNSGTYRCEVSEEGPYFETDYREATMNVIDVPAEGPRISGLEPAYRPGEKVKLNCTSGPSRPSAVLDWYINDKLAPENFVSRPRGSQGTGGRGGVDLSNQGTAVTSWLEFSVPSLKDRHSASSWNVSCVATVGEIYEKTAQALVYFNDPKPFTLSKSTTIKPPYHLQATGSPAMCLSLSQLLNFVLLLVVTLIN